MKLLEIPFWQATISFVDQRPGIVTISFDRNVCILLSIHMLSFQEIKEGQICGCASHQRRLFSLARSQEVGIYPCDDCIVRIWFWLGIPTYPHNFRISRYNLQISLIYIHLANQLLDDLQVEKCPQCGFCPKWRSNFFSTWMAWSNSFRRRKKQDLAISSSDPMRGKPWWFRESMTWTFGCRENVKIDEDSVFLRTVEVQSTVHPWQ